MNSTVARIGAVTDAVSVLGFAVCMLIEFDFGSYLSCMFFAFGFVMMIAGYHAESDETHKQRQIRLWHYPAFTPFLFC